MWRPGPTRPVAGEETEHDDDIGGLDLGGLVRHHRQALGLSQEDLGERAELSVRAIRNLERGAVRRPRRDTLRRLAAALTLDADESDRLLAVVRRGTGTGSGPASRVEQRCRGADTCPDGGPAGQHGWVGVMSDRTADWPWPPELDAVLAAPESHEILLADERVRVLAVTVPAGQTEPRHTHRCRSVMIVFADASIRYHRDDAPPVDSPALASRAPRAHWLDPEGPHWVENLDTRPFRAIRVEFKAE
jgi:transcriptional regulator with XRE-family HTH domain